MKFNYLPLYSKFIKSETELKNIVGDIFNLLDKAGGNKVSHTRSKNDLPIFYFLVTGGTEHLIKEAREASSNPFGPVYIIAHPAHNSLPASLESLSMFHQNKIDGRIFYIDGENSIRELEEFVERLLKPSKSICLEDLRIGLIGEPSDWLIASKPDFSIVKSVWGPSIIPISIDEVEREIKNLTKEDVSEEYQSLLSGAVRSMEPSAEDLINNAKVYVAIKNLTHKMNLDAVTIRCFDLLIDLSTSGCFAISELNNSGLIAGCEGDLVSTVTMLWINKILNRIPWMANPSKIDREKNSLWLAHCTVPTSMVKNYNLRSHFETGLSVGIEGEFEKGPVTLIRVGGKYMEKIWIAEGDIISNGNSETLCRTQVEIKLKENNVEDLLINPLGNHIVMVEGRHSEILSSWWMKNIKKTYN